MTDLVVLTGKRLRMPVLVYTYCSEKDWFLHDILKRSL